MSAVQLQRWSKWHDDGAYQREFLQSEFQIYIFFYKTVITLINNLNKWSNNRFIFTSV